HPAPSQHVASMSVEIEFARKRRLSADGILAAKSQEHQPALSRTHRPSLQWRIGLRLEDRVEIQGRVRPAEQFEFEGNGRVWWRCHGLAGNVSEIHTGDLAGAQRPHKRQDARTWIERIILAAKEHLPVDRNSIGTTLYLSPRQHIRPDHVLANENVGDRLR